MKPAFFARFLLGLLAASALLLAPARSQTAGEPAPPPSAPPKRSAADLEKLVGPIALYPDPVIATMLPASVYPLEIVQAARFVADTNNLSKLDDQPWDENVKAVARIPAVIKKMNDDLTWTQELGEAFLADDKGVMDAIQVMRNKAQKAGTLQTTPQQIVTVTNMVVEKTVEQQVVVVTNTIVQIEPSNPQIVYVPTYNPYTVYYPPPAYVVNPYPLLTFGAGIAVGAIIANNCNWYGGGIYHGHGGNYNNININGDININSGNRVNNGNIGSGNRPGNGQGQKWQPDQNRLSKSGSANTAAQSREARGYSSTSNVSAGNRTGNAVANRPTAGAGAGAGVNRPTTANASANVGNRQAGGGFPGGDARPSAGNAGSFPGGNAARNTPSASTANRSTSSAFGGNMNSGANTRQQSSRGAASRGGGGRAGGGGRGGGGRR